MLRYWRVTLARERITVSLKKLSPQGALDRIENPTATINTANQAVGLLSRCDQEEVSNEDIKRIVSALPLEARGDALSAYLVGQRGMVLAELPNLHCDIGAETLSVASKNKVNAQAIAALWKQLDTQSALEQDEATVFKVVDTLLEDKHFDEAVAVLELLQRSTSETMKDIVLQRVVFSMMSQEVAPESVSKVLLVLRNSIQGRVCSLQVHLMLLFVAAYKNSFSQLEEAWDMLRLNPSVEIVDDVLREVVLAGRGLRTKSPIVADWLMDLYHYAKNRGLETSSTAAFRGAISEIVAALCEVEEGAHYAKEIFSAHERDISFTKAYYLGLLRTIGRRDFDFARRVVAEAVRQGYGQLGQYPSDIDIRGILAEAAAHAPEKPFYGGLCEVMNPRRAGEDDPRLTAHIVRFYVSAAHRDFGNALTHLQQMFPFLTTTLIRQLHVVPDGSLPPLRADFAFNELNRMVELRALGPENVILLSKVAETVLCQEKDYPNLLRPMLERAVSGHAVVVPLHEELRWMEKWRRECKREGRPAIDWGVNALLGSQRFVGAAMDGKVEKGM